VAHVVAAPAAPKHVLASLRHRDFRLLCFGTLVSSAGDQMQSIGIAWHMYALTNSALQLGMLGIFRAVPFMGLSLAGGAMADAIDRKKLLFVTQASQMGLTMVLVGATATGHAAPWLLYGITFFSGAASAFDAPTRQAILPTLLPRSEFSGAMTLMTIQRRTAMILGPGLGGLIIARFGLASNYFGNALSFLAVVVAVLLMGPLPKIHIAAANNRERILGGIYFARKEPLVIVPMLLDFFTRASCSATALLPIFARDVFAAGAEGLGLLSMATSAGAVAGGLLLGSTRQTKHPIALMMAAYIAEGLCFLGFGLAPGLGIAWAMLFLKGIGNVVGEVLRLIVMQMKTPDEVRGRVTALSGIFDSGGPYVGQLEAGVLADLIGPVAAAVWSGTAAAVIALGFGLTPAIRKGLRLHLE
jgi:MFS family permease